MTSRMYTLLQVQHPPHDSRHESLPPRSRSPVAAMRILDLLCEEDRDLAEQLKVDWPDANSDDFEGEDEGIVGDEEEDSDDAFDNYFRRVNEELSADVDTISVAEATKIYNALICTCASAGDAPGQGVVCVLDQLRTITNSEFCAG